MFVPRWNRIVLRTFAWIHFALAISTEIIRIITSDRCSLQLHLCPGSLPAGAPSCPAAPVRARGMIQKGPVKNLQRILEKGIAIPRSGEHIGDTTKHGLDRVPPPLDPQLKIGKAAGPPGARGDQIPKANDTANPHRYNRLDLQHIEQRPPGCGSGRSLNAPMGIGAIGSNTCRTGHAGYLIRAQVIRTPNTDHTLTRGGQPGSIDLHSDAGSPVAGNDGRTAGKQGRS